MSMPMGGGNYQTAPQVSFDWLSRGWDMFRAKAGTWVVAILVYLIIVGVIFGLVGIPTGYWANITAMINARSAGIPPTGVNPFAQVGQNLILGLIVNLVAIVLLGGLYRMGIRQARGQDIAVGDLFSAFDVALPLIGFAVLNQIISTIAFYLCIIPAFIVGGLFMFAPLLILDRGVGPIQAISESVNMLKSQWLMAAVFYFVAALIGGIGAVVCGVGLLVTLPIFLLSIVAGYVAFTQPPPGYEPPPPGTTPGVWPPPPGAPPTL